MSSWSSNKETLLLRNNEAVSSTLANSFGGLGKEWLAGDYVDKKSAAAATPTGNPTPTVQNPPKESFLKKVWSALTKR